MFKITFFQSVFLAGLRTTPLRLMVFAQALAIAAQLSVLLTADRYQQLFTQEAASLLGGDLVVNADREPPLVLWQAAQNAGLSLAKTTAFNSVALSNTAQTLVSVKAVDEAYPLRGRLVLSTLNPKSALRENIHHKPLLLSGQVWVDQAVLSRLNLRAGDSLSLGNQSFLIADVIANESDRGLQLINIAPRVMMLQSDLAATGLLGQGSRATYRWQMVGEPSAQATFKSWIQQHQIAGIRLESMEEGRPEMRMTLDRAKRFMGLIAMLTTVIAGCALGLVAHIWSQEQTQMVALMRTLGASRRKVARHLLKQLISVTVLGLSLGVLLGYGVHSVLSHWLSVSQNIVLPLASYRPYFQAILLLVGLLSACVLLPIDRLINRTPMSIFRAQISPKQTQAPLFRRIMFYGFSVAFLVVLLVWITGDFEQGLIVLLGVLAVIACVGLCAYGLFRLALKLGRHHNVWLVRMASRGLLRNLVLTMVQASTLTLALLGVLMLTSLQSEVLNAWKTLLPADSPNQFVFNIQPDQADSVQQALLDFGVAKVHLQPMVRARLVQVNDRLIDASQYLDERAKSILNREFNMSYGNTLPDGNSVVAGQWHGSINRQSNLSNQISMEAGIVKTLGLKLGDQLRFDIAGQSMQYTLSSLRKLRWESLNVNFFAIGSPNSSPILARDLPQTYIVAIFVPASLDLTRLIRRFPNLTVLDVGQLSQQANEVLNKVGKALNLLFALGGVAAVLVVAVIAYASRLARMRETALLRMLGASARQVAKAQLLEQVIVGALAGLIAGATSYVTVSILANQVLELPVDISPLTIASGIFLGMSVNVLGYTVLQWHLNRASLAQNLRGLGV
jgi:putative ABC transport system permease protein